MSANADLIRVPKRIEILAEESAPPITPVPVTVHYVESGVQKAIAVNMRLPTYFDKIVVAVVHEILPGLPSPPIDVNSIKNAARFGYHAARSVEVSIRPPVVLLGPVFDTRSWEPNNMAHLLLDLIPFSLHARRAANMEVTCLFRRLGKNFSELLRLFGVNPVFERRRVEAEVIKLRGTRGLAVYDLNLRNTFDCPGVCLIPNPYSSMDFFSSTSFEKVFLARRGPRSLLNQAQVEEVSRKFGYVTVFMEDYSLSEQLSIGTHAKHVLAVHGAAMSFLVMNKSVESIVELLPPNNYAALFPVSLGSRVRRYEQIMPEFDQAVAHNGWSAIVRFKDLPFAVDTDLLERLLSEIH